MDEVLKRISQLTGRVHSECCCERCQEQCKSPCLGTPEDILRLIRAGYADKLKLTYWGVAVILGKLPYPTLMVQPRKTKNGCVFFKDGLCELHTKGLKPTEGKLSHHTIGWDNLIFEKSISWQVAKEWMRFENLEIVLEAILYMKVFH